MRDGSSFPAATERYSDDAGESWPGSFAFGCRGDAGESGLLLPEQGNRAAHLISYRIFPKGNRELCSGTIDPNGSERSGTDRLMHDAVKRRAAWPPLSGAWRGTIEGMRGPRSGRRRL